MSQRAWAVAAVLTVCASPLWAQDTIVCNGLNPEVAKDAYRAFECINIMEGELLDTLANMKKMQDTVAALQSTVAKLEQQVRRNEASVSGAATRLDDLDIDSATDGMVPATGNHPGTKAVVAFTSDKGEKTCPSGWTPFEAAKDRFILGAGNAYPVVGTKGGEAITTLGEANIPAHRHALPRLKMATDLDWRDANERGYFMPYFDVDASGAVDQRQPNFSSKAAGVSSTGSGEAFTNMPPYIALYFCVKS